MKPIGPGTDAELLDKLNSFADGIARSLDSGSVSRDFLRVSAAISARVDMLSPEIMELLDVFDSFAGGIARSLDSGDSGAVNRAYSLASATRLLIALIKDHKAARVNKDVLSQLVTTHFFLRFMDRVLDSGGLTKIAEGVSNGINLKDAWPRAAKLAKAGRGRSTGGKNGAKGRYRTPDERAYRDVKIVAKFDDYRKTNPKMKAYELTADRCGVGRRTVERVIRKRHSP